VNESLTRLVLRFPTKIAKLFLVKFPTSFVSTRIKSAAINLKLICNVTAIILSYYFFNFSAFPEKILTIKKIIIMSYQNISATVSAADLQAVKDAIAVIQQKLPFLVNLTADERKSILKTGPNSLSFVQNAQQAAQNNPDIFPKSFDVTEFTSDVTLFAVLTEINTAVAQLGSSIDDTRMAVGGEAMKEATQVYTYVKTAAASTPGLKPVADQLGQRFQKASAATPAPTPAAHP